MSHSSHFEVVPLHEVPKAGSPQMDGNDRPQVLVVDDERVIADTLSIILGKHGFATRTAYDGEAALAMAYDRAPDLLLSDVMMGPGIDGTELAIEVVRACPSCKVLLFSGHSETRNLLLNAQEAGHYFTLLMKPLHPADLLERISAKFPELAVA